MPRKLLRQTVPIAGSLILAATLFFGVGAWRRSEDTKWCRNATATSALPGEDQPAIPDLLERQRSACAVQRQRQRVMFGAVWRSGGQEAAECGFDLARLQLLSDQDPGTRSAILKKYRMNDSGSFDASSRQGQERFLQACLRDGRREAR